MHFTSASRGPDNLGPLLGAVLELLGKFVRRLQAALGTHLGRLGASGMHSGSILGHLGNSQGLPTGVDRPRNDQNIACMSLGTRAICFYQMLIYFVL